AIINAAHYKTLLLLLLPLAVTSTHAMRRRLGKRWKQLHRAIYAIALLATLHLLWLSRSDIGDAVVYGLLFALLLGWRVRHFWRRRRVSRPAAS
ncbi:MAG: hypothetical protein VW016_05600, partial [Luminiphilus sp.]